MYHFLCRLAADLLLAGLGGPTPGGQQHCQLTDKSRAETVLATIDNYRVFANIFHDYNSIQSHQSFQRILLMFVGYFDRYGIKIFHCDTLQAYELNVANALNFLKPVHVTFG